MYPLRQLFFNEEHSIDAPEPLPASLCPLPAAKSPHAPDRSVTPIAAERSVSPMPEEEKEAEENEENREAALFSPGEGLALDKIKVDVPLAPPVAAAAPGPALKRRRYS